MDWISSLGENWLNTLEWLLAFSVAFGIVARLTPCNPGMYWWKNLRAVGTDLLYWFIVPLFLSAWRTLMLIVGVVLLWGGKDPRFLPLKNFSLWQEGLAILLIQDVMLYWLHRLFHTRAAWKFHAVHHSPKILDWMSSARFHPINHLLTFGVANVGVLLMGFSPAAIVVLAPINLIYAAMVHANLNWTFGPLRYVFASPVFHRWHHTTLREGLNKNFASIFPFLDVMFGTFYMPPGKLPEQFGNSETDFPEDFWGQFIQPFTKKTRPALACETADATARQSRTPWSRVTLRGVLSVLVVASLAGSPIYFVSLVVTASEQRVEQDRRLKEEKTNVQQPTFSRHAGPVQGVAISGDGKIIVSACKDGTVKVWDAATGREERTILGSTSGVLSVAISAEGERIVAGNTDGMVKVWDAATGLEQLSLAGHVGPVYGVAISADGGRIVSAGGDGTLKVWDALTGRKQFTIQGSPSASSILSIAVSGNGQRIVSASEDGMIKVWNGLTGWEEHTLKGHTSIVLSVAISSDGRHIVSGGCDRTVKVWDARTGREERTLTGHAVAVLGVAMSADGKQVVSGSADGMVKVWDAFSGRETILLAGHLSATLCVAISADGRRVVTGSRDGTISACDSATLALD
jgi:sterol desaturase/sphingolipid hydroxylase (fatty acid hydroxylase superfamily)/DNA-binding beta-propeller fold protein YncE